MKFATLACLALLCGTALPALAAVTTNAHGSAFPGPPPEPPPPPPPPPTPGGSYGGPGDTTPPDPSTPGPSGPSTPGSGPSAPTPSGGSGPKTPGPGGPSTPTGGGASGGGGGPSTPSSKTPDFEVRIDAYDWQLWWHLNKDPYLDLKNKLHSVTSTGTDDFFIGHGQERTRVRALEPERDELENRVLPVLLTAIRNERNNDVVTAAMIAAAKIGLPKHRGDKNPVDEAIRTRLDDPVQEIRETALLALGISGDDRSYSLLRSVMLDKEDGRRATGRGETKCDQRSRAFAAFALGLLGSRSEIPPLRRLIVQDLVAVLDGPRQATNDLKIAAALAYGLVRVEPAKTKEEVEAEGLGPWATRGHQLDYALRFCFAEDRDDLRPEERAHMARSVALLLEGLPEAERDAVVERLSASISGRTRSLVAPLRQSVVLALGQLGDCDDDEADKDLRRALVRSLKDPDPQVQNFAVVAMGLVGARVEGGDGTGAAAAKELRRELARNLANGKRRRSWAGLAIGLMERGFAEAGRAHSQDQLAALSKSLDDRRSGNEAAAYAVGLGLARHRDATPILLRQLESQSTDQVRGEICIALGLMDARAAAEALDEVVESSRYRASLLEKAAIGLGLMGDASIAPELARMLKEDARSLSSQAAIASALGFIGDSRSIDPLLEMFADDELTDGARAFAAGALGIVGDRDDLPWRSKYTVGINYFALSETLVSGGNGMLEIL